MDDLFPGWNNRPNASNTPGDRGPMLIGVNASFVSLSLIFVVARMYTRAVYTKKWYLEDWLIGFTWVLTFASATISSMTTWHYVGKHYRDIPPGYLQRKVSFPAVYINSMLYWIAVMIIKVAILLLYLRLTPSTKFRNCVYVAIAFIIATSFSMGMVTSFPCRHPISASWDYSARFATTKCVNYAKVLKTQGFFHLIGDLVILFLPFPVMWKSSMARMQKTHVMILLSLGGCVSIISAWRLHCIFTIHRPEYIIDYKWAVAELLALSAAELNIGIVCSCLPAARLILAGVFPKLFGGVAYAQPQPLHDANSEENLRGSPVKKSEANTSSAELNTIDFLEREAKGKLGDDELEVFKENI